MMRTSKPGRSWSHSTAGPPPVSSVTNLNGRNTALCGTEWCPFLRGPGQKSQSFLATLPFGYPAVDVPGFCEPAPQLLGKRFRQIFIGMPECGRVGLDALVDRDGQRFPVGMGDQVPVTDHSQP